MEKRIVYIFLLCCLLISCHSPQHEAKQLNRTLHRQEQKAISLTSILAERLQGESFDSIWTLTQNSTDNCLFYVFNHQRLVYWSDNWLAGDEVLLSSYNKWYYQRFTNAHCVCRWTKAGEYNILTVIPVKYAYPFVNRQLSNDFIYPFKAYKDLDITLSRNDAMSSVFSSDGTFLFALTTNANTQKVQREQTGLADSFSYRALLSDEGDTTNGNRHISKIRIYFFLEIVLYAIIILLGIFGLIRARGFHKMKIRTKVYYVINMLVLFVSVYVFAVSAIHTRKRYESQQRDILVKKTGYIQKALQESYFWNISISERNETGMNIDLRDLSFTYETDILVYDLHGNLVGSSAPALFEKGIVSRHIAPEPFFSRNAEMTQYEHIGDMHYLAAYTQFYNGNYVQIGYIAVPMFIYDEEVEEEVDRFLAKLLPPNLIVLLLSFLISFFIVRNITQPLSALTESMRNLKIGQINQLLQYTGDDEVGEVVRRYNEMVEELQQSSERLARSEREGAWRTMARQIAHEINNPLTPMKLTIQQLQRTKLLGDTDKFNEYFDKSTSMLIEQIDNLSKIAQSFSQFAKIPEVVTEKVDVASRLFSVISLFRSNSAHLPIRYIGAENGVYAMADKVQISQVFNNLIKNALQAIENKSDGDIIVMLQQKNDIVEISVSDNGCGIAQEIQDKIFRPNFTTKSTGAGLGLVISKNIVEGSGGSISFTTSPSGTTFIVQLRTN